MKSTGVSRGREKSIAAHMRGDSGVQPASVDVVAHKVRALDHLHTVVHRRADLAADLHLLQRDHHRADGALACVALGKQVPELRAQVFVQA